MFLYFGDGGEIVQLVLQPLQFVQAAAGFPRRKTAVFVEHDGGGQPRLIHSACRKFATELVERDAAVTALPGQRLLRRFGQRKFLQPARVEKKIAVAEIKIIILPEQTAAVDCESRTHQSFPFVLQSDGAAAEIFRRP